MSRRKTSLSFWDYHLGARPTTRKVGLAVLGLFLIGMTFIFFSNFDESSPIMPVLGLSFVAVAIVANVQHERLRREDRRNVDPLASRIKVVETALLESSALFDELRAELETRTVALENLRVAAVEHERLAALNADQADAVQRLISATINNANRTLARSTLRQQIVFYIFGLISGIPVTLLTRMLT